MLVCSVETLDLSIFSTATATKTLWEIPEMISAAAKWQESCTVTHCLPFESLLRQHVAASR
jgi:hypothetical protein